MAILNSTVVMSMLRNYKVCHLGGRFGSGKTALAFELANELKSKGHVRYILANIDSVWTDDPEKVQLRYAEDGIFVDAVVILDEGGTFLESGFDAKVLLQFLRKLNIIILIPSRIPPSLKLRFLTIQRIFNMGVIGLPLWLYRLDLSDMKIKEHEQFGWWRPSEIFGIYDTQGMPMDDDYLRMYFDRWIKQAAQAKGYERKTLAFFNPSISSVPSTDNASLLQGAINSANSLGTMEGYGRIAAALEEVAEAQHEAISVYSEFNGRKRRAKR